MTEPRTPVVRVTDLIKVYDLGDAKVQALQAHAAKAGAEAKAKSDKRVAEIRADYERRSALMQQASVLVKESLKP